MKNLHLKTKSYWSVVMFTALIAGCQTPSPSTLPTVFNNKIQIAESIERLELYTRPTGLELSARDQVSVNQFLAAYAQQGEGPIHINIPSNSAQGLGAQQAQALIRQSLGQVGLSGASVQACLLYTSPSPRDQRGSRMPSSA